MLLLQREVNWDGYNIIFPHHAIWDYYDNPMEIIKKQDILRHNEFSK